MHESNTRTSSRPEFAGAVDVILRVSCPVSPALLEDITRRIISDAGFRSGSVSVAVIGDAEMHALNRTYLDHDYPTDVLSFLLDSDSGSGTIEGEVVVSQDTANASANSFGWSPENELVLYVIHGLLHLTGMDDATPGERDAMTVAENRYLAEWGIVRPVPDGPETS